jgi:TRAP-type uncharacterized transport system substrate-binding protein
MAVTSISCAVSTMRELVARVTRFRPLAWTTTFPWREWLFVGVPVAVAVIAALWIAGRYIQPALPKRVVLATGPDGGAYQAFGERYRKVFEREGVTLELLQTKGARDNYKLVRGPVAAGAKGDGGSNGTPPLAAPPEKKDEPLPHVDAAFVRGGIGTGEEAPQLVSLGTVAYEALWVFCRGKATLDDLPGLKGMTVAIGGRGAGMRRMVRNLLKANGIDEDEIKALDVGGVEAAEALLTGKADCVFLLESPEAGILKALLYAPDAQIVNFRRRADAYIKYMPFLQKVVLPEGGIDLAANTPHEPLTLLAAQTQILANEGLHPAIQMLLLQAAKEVHGTIGMFNAQGELPAPNRFDFPLSEQAERYFERGRPFLQRYLPFWLANLVDRAIVVLIPAFAIVFPLVRMLPPLYAWRMRRRIYRWYGELMFIENEMRRTLTKGETRDFADRLNWIEQEVNELHTPLAYANQLYSLRQHIEFVQQKLEQIVQQTTPAVVEPTVTAPG